MNIDELLEAERHRTGFSKEERAAMWQGIERSVGLTGAAATTSDTNAASTNNASTKNNASMNSAGVDAAGTNGAAAAGRLASWKLGTLLTIAALGGVGIGAAGHARWGAPKIVHVEHIAPSTTVVTTGVPSVPSVESTSSVPASPPVVGSAVSAVRGRANVPPARSAQVASSVSAIPSPKDPSLARERTLLDMARTALSRGDVSAALVSLDTHAREFPSSQLAQEREVLAIQALAVGNRLPEARRRGAAFRASYPTSPLLPIVDEATQ